MAEQETSGSSPAPGTWIVHFEPGSFLEAMLMEEPRNNYFAVCSTTSLGKTAEVFIVQ